MRLLTALNSHIEYVSSYFREVIQLFGGRSFYQVDNSGVYQTNLLNMYNSNGAGKHRE